VDYEFITSADDLGRIANEIASVHVVGIDLETTALNPYDGKVRIISINTGRNIYVVDLFETGTLGPLKDALASEKVIKILQNVKFDQRWLLYHYDLELWPVFDTFRASALIHNGRNRGHNLYDLYARELGVFPAVSDLGASNWAGSLTQEQKDYAAEDVLHLFGLRDKLKPQLARLGLNKVALIEFGAILPEAAVENTGLYLDSERWLVLAQENEIKRLEVRKFLLENLPNPSNQLTFLGMESDFNLDSNQQILASLVKLGVKERLKDEEGNEEWIPVTSTKEILLAQQASKFPIIEQLFKYREYSKAVSTYGPDYLKHISLVTGRIHSNYYPFTGCGRYASSKPNLQNLPRLFAFRDCFRAQEGYVFIICDYGAIEMRGAAQIAPDPTLIKVFQDGIDAHIYTASFVNNKPQSEITKADRQGAKAINFGLVYGMGPEKLILYAQSNYGVTYTLSQARKVRSKYFELYNGIASWHKRAIRDGKRTRCAHTLTGRLRYLDPDRTYSEWFNTSVQGSCADGLKAALRDVHLRLKKYNGDAKIVHHVHDEIILEVKKDPELIAAATAELELGMKNAMGRILTKVPITVEANSGDSWGTAK